MSPYQDHEAIYDNLRMIHWKSCFKVMNTCKLKSWEVKAINCNQSLPINCPFDARQERVEVIKLLVLSENITVTLYIDSPIEMILITNLKQVQV